MPAFCQCGFFSESLGMCVNINVIVPQNSNSNIGIAQLNSSKKLFPVIYLLHGLSDDYSIWSRRTSIELFAAPYECIIVMPSGGRSFYRNMASGPKYKDFITKDLPNFIESTFPAEPCRESRYICGLSMGGYGALAIGLEFPERYSKIAAFSSVADIHYFADKYLTPEEKKSIFKADKLEGTSDDLFYLAEKTVSSPDRPQILLACGTEDFLYESNIKFFRHLENIKYPYTSIEVPGIHNWVFWNEQIQNALKFFMA
ncbi:MAG: esterase family protein [Lentisphaeria bacterium]|nr:esterase family protein [Lentisphaeria bacterium]